MSEKGGKKSADVEMTKVDAKVILTAIIGVFVGALVVLILMFIGMRVNENYHLNLSNKKGGESEVVTSILPIKYETMAVSYGNNKEDAAKTLKKLGDKNGSGYVVIKSNSELTNVLDQLKMKGAVVDGIKVEDNFFNTGSIILINGEAKGLSHFGVETITRDQDYNIYIETSIVAANDVESVSGKAIMIKVDNIQPKHVEVKNRTE